MSHAISRRRLVVRGAVAGSVIRMLRMKSGIHAPCRRERRAATRRTPLHESGSGLPQALLAQSLEVLLLSARLNNLQGGHTVPDIKTPEDKTAFRVSRVESFRNLDGQKQKIRDLRRNTRFVCKMQFRLPLKLVGSAPTPDSIERGANTLVTLLQRMNRLNEWIRSQLVRPCEFRGLCGVRLRREGREFSSRDWRS
jgi:hypothetical protein